MLTTNDMEALRAIGFPGLVDKPSAVTAEQVSLAVVHALSAPSARTVEAAALALLWLASEDKLRGQDWGDESSRRRVGFVAERLAARESVDAEIGARLRRLADSLRGTVDVEGACHELLTPTKSRRRVEHLRAAGNEVNAKWGVFGAVDLRPELLGRVQR